MRLLFVNTFSEPNFLGGAERTLKTLVDGLHGRGHDVRVVSLTSDAGTNRATVPDHTSRYPTRNIFTPDGARPHLLPAKIVWHALDLYNPIAARDLQREIAEFRPDVMSCHNLSGWSIAAWDSATRHGVPFVQVLHDYYLMCVTGTRSKGGVACKKACRRCKTLRCLHVQKSAKAAAVVGISDHILELFLNSGYFKGVKTRQIYNAEPPLHVDLERLTSPEKPVFGFIGRVSPHKGVETLLRAFRSANLPEGSTLLIAGDGEPSYVAGLKRTFESPSIRFLDSQRPEDFFPELSWCVVPSISDEPLGRVVFESLGYGVPVLGSDRGGIPEMIEVGRNGYLFEAGNVTALRAQLERVSLGNHATPRLDIAKTAATFFDTGRFLDQYEELYRALGRTPLQGTAAA